MTNVEPKQTNILFEKIKVGLMELPNRIVFGSHPTNFSVNHLFTEQHLAYYEARAKGGTGLIVLEEQLVHPSDLPYEKALFGYDERIIEGYKIIADTVHKYGCKVVAQLNHSGMQSEGSTNMRELWAPSAIADVVSGEVPKAMEFEDIQEVIEGFVKVAGNVVKGNLDGVEINAGQFSLLRQFMSPLTNTRRDAYGGILENRLRLTREVLTDVRRVIGFDKILGLRLCCDEFAPWGGLTPQDSVEIAKNLVELNAIDYITVTVGSLYTLHLTPATYYEPEGFSVEVAAQIKKAVSVPVFAEGRIHSAKYAESIIKQGLVDAVCMNRALIADPDLPVKITRGLEELIRGCLSCNQGCQVRRSMGKPLSCTINPTAGVEKKQKEPKKPPRSKKILIIGGGPAGMEAAVRAAQRGHQVTLWEASSSLGGHLLLHGNIPQYINLIENWNKLSMNHQVQIVTAKYAEVEDVIAEKADAVIIATGTLDGEPPVNPLFFSCISAAKALREELNNKTILFWDEVGDQLMARTVEKLLNDGNTLYYVTPDLFAGTKIAATSELARWNPLFMNRVSGVYPMNRIEESYSHTVIIKNIFSNITTTLNGVDVIVHNSWPKPNDTLYIQLLGKVSDLHRIGDCLAPRGVGPAIRDGYLLGSSI